MKENNYGILDHIIYLGNKIQYFSHTLQIPCKLEI